MATGLNFRGSRESIDPERASNKTLEQLLNTDGAKCSFGPFINHQTGDVNSFSFECCGSLHPHIQARSPHYKLWKQKAIVSLYQAQHTLTDKPGHESGGD
jgi:hypothetical protein